MNGLQIPERDAPRKILSYAQPLGSPVGLPLLPFDDSNLTANLSTGSSGLLKVT